METGHPVGGPLSRAFSAIVIIAELWRPEVGRPGNFVRCLRFLEKRPLTAKFSKFCFESFHSLTDWRGCQGWQVGDTAFCQITLNTCYYYDYDWLICWYFDLSWRSWYVCACVMWRDRYGTTSCYAGIRGVSVACTRCECPSKRSGDRT